ncbi:MAG: hypothetical protein IKR19_07960 [Acholeplasmatales bacterium]|nr:hypothetical protein [Acholeplasmatales bacterium]
MAEEDIITKDYENLIEKERAITKQTYEGTLYLHRCWFDSNKNMTNFKVFPPIHAKYSTLKNAFEVAHSDEDGFLVTFCKPFDLDKNNAKEYAISLIEKEV